MNRIDAGLVRRWMDEATDALRRERAALDRVNVFPVADADTGTNMYLTFAEGQRAVARAPAGADGADLLAAAARAALIGARGNSGVILSEWLRGASLAAHRDARGATILAAAARSARGAVASPVDGTILTTADAAADAALAAQDAGADPGGIARAAVTAARESARASMVRHPVLAAAGVLDAGACGLVLVLGALLAAVMSDTRGTMSPVSLELVVEQPGGGAAPAAAPASSSAVPDVPLGAGDGHAPAAWGDLELMFVLTRETSEPDVAGGQDEAGDAAGDDDAGGGGADSDLARDLRARLGATGDSVVVVGGATGTTAAVWQAHVHTGDLPAALDVAATASRNGGLLSQVHVRHLEAAGGTEWGVVAVTPAPALAAQFAHAGAVALLTGGFGAAVGPVTKDDVERAAASAGSRRVLVLADAALGEPDGGELDEIVRLDAPDPVSQVVVLAALAAAAHPDDPVPELRSVLSGLRVIGPLAGAATADVLTRALGESEAPAVVTLLMDDDATHLAAQLAQPLAAGAPLAELVALPTGRPGHQVWLGLEPAADRATLTEGA